MGWFFKSDMERAEELRGIRIKAEAESLWRDQKAKEEQERRRDQLESDLAFILRKEPKDYPWRMLGMMAMTTRDLRHPGLKGQIIDIIREEMNLYGQPEKKSKGKS